MNKKQKIVLMIFIGLLLIVGGYFGYSIISKKNNKSNEDKDTLLLNKKYKNLYAFKFTDDSIYMLKDNEDDSLLVNYKEKICGGKTCGELDYLDYEFKDGKLYLYYFGNQSEYYYKHYDKSITVYSIDFTKDDTSLNKEYVISKDEGYVTAVTQNDSSIFFSSYVWDGTTLERSHKLYEFSKKSGESKEIYDLDNYETLHEIMVNNNKLYMEYSDHENASGRYGNSILEMNLDNYSTHKLLSSDERITYDTISNKIITHINEGKTIQITDIKDYSTKEKNERFRISNAMYSINDTLIYYIDNQKTVKIRGKKEFNIDLKEYVKEDMLDLYNVIELADNHSIAALVYTKSSNSPRVFKINFLTGKVKEEKLEGKYLYIK